MTSTTLRRSSRIAALPNSSVTEEYSYPDGPPVSELEKWVSKLDLQSFPSQDYARIDDILVYALFGSKRSYKNYRALMPSRVFLEDSPSVSNEIGLEICNIYLSHGRHNTNSPSISSAVSQLLIHKYPSIFSGPRDKDILTQCVPSILHPWTVYRRFSSLVQRYHIMNYTSASVVRIEKVKFGSQIACGLRAKVRIEAFTAILSTCSSMSLDIVDGKRAVSVINSSPRQKGPVGPRLILGPFRFANHDCSPNCQVSGPIISPILNLQICYVDYADPRHPRIHHLYFVRGGPWGAYHSQLCE